MGEPLAGTRERARRIALLRPRARVEAIELVRSIEMRSRARSGYEAKAPPEAPVTMSPTDTPILPRQATLELADGPTYRGLTAMRESSRLPRRAGKLPTRERKLVSG